MFELLEVQDIPDHIIDSQACNPTNTSESHASSPKKVATLEMTKDERAEEEIFAIFCFLLDCFSIRQKIIEL